MKQLFRSLMILPTITISFIFLGLTQLTQKEVDEGYIGVSNEKCIKAPLEKVHEAAVYYEKYKDVPGAKYSVSINPFDESEDEKKKPKKPNEPEDKAKKLKKTLTVMKTSQPNYKSAKIKTPGGDLQSLDIKEDADGNGTIDFSTVGLALRETAAYVEVVIRPKDLKDPKDEFYFPKFSLYCTSTFPSATKFKHTCDIAQDKKKYALDNFHSEVTATQGGGHCEPEEVFLDYTIKLKPNIEQMTAIKEKIKSYYPLGTGFILDLFFDPKKFLTELNASFYDSWSNEIVKLKP